MPRICPNSHSPPKYAFDLQIMMLPDEGLVLVLSEKEPLENKSGAQLLQALQEMKRVFEEKKAEIGAAEKKAQAGENAGESGKKNKKAAEAQKPQFAIFAFRNIGRVIEYAAVLPTNLRIDSTLYRMEDGTCYAYVRKGGASYERYSRACIQAMEFAALYTADDPVTGRREHLSFKRVNLEPVACHQISVGIPSHASMMGACVWRAVSERDYFAQVLM
jgi:hypothetical protein